MPARAIPNEASEESTAFGRGFLRGAWYFAALASEVKAGSLTRLDILGEPVVIGRTRGGAAFALRDICPHRAAPLSAGRLRREADGAESLECIYHGWRFRPDGTCAAIPSLVAGQSLDLARIRVRALPLAESQGVVFFLWLAGEGRRASPMRRRRRSPGWLAGAQSWCCARCSRPMSIMPSSA